MSTIAAIKKYSDEKIHVTLEMTQEEVLRLRGNLENAHLFTEQVLDSSTRLVQRGKRESTKYFLLPREYRKGVYPTNSVDCTKFETDNKHLFIFAVDKIKV